MIPNLQRVKLHCYLHGITNPKSPDGGIDRERAARERDISGLWWEGWGLYSFCGPARFSSLGQRTNHPHSAEGKQNIQDQKMTSPPPYSTSSEAQGSHCQLSGQRRVLKSAVLGRALCMHRLTLASSGTCLCLPPIKLTSRDANVPVPVTLQPRNQTGRIKVCLEEGRIMMV